jgi:MFS transporter, PAT family, beta-lactamase induction signal transducer AmpG
MIKRRSKIVLLTSLYASQILPAAFFMEALPVFMRRQGVSLEIIGLTSLLILPWMLKFLWSPLVDRFGWTRWGHYKSWILATQSLLAVTLLTCSQFNVKANPMLLIVALLMVATLAATQDIATDALAIQLLSTKERGIGNGIQSAGSFFGRIIGGGAMLIVLNRLGWNLSLVCLGGMMLVSLIPILRYRELPTPPLESHDNYFQQLLAGLRRRGIVRWMLILMLYVTGRSLASTMFSPLLVDIGFSIESIGRLSILTSIAGIVGSLGAGYSMESLGRKRSLVIFGSLEVIALAGLILPSIGISAASVIYTVAIYRSLVQGMTTTAVFTVMMDKSRLQMAGTDYTLQTAAYLLGHHVGIPTLSGFIAKAIGYDGLFIASTSVCAIGVVVVSREFQEV